MADYDPLPYKINPKKSSPPGPSSPFHTKSPPSPPSSSPFYPQSSPAPALSSPFYQQSSPDPPSSSPFLPQPPPPRRLPVLTPSQKGCIFLCFLVSLLTIFCIIIAVLVIHAKQTGLAQAKQRKEDWDSGKEVRTCVKWSKYYWRTPECLKYKYERKKLPVHPEITVQKVPKIATNLVETLDILNELDRTSSDDCRQPPRIGGGTWRDCQQNIQMEYFNGTKCTFGCDGDLVLSTSKGFNGQHDESVVFTCVRTHWVPSVPVIVKCLTVMEFESQYVG